MLKEDIYMYTLEAIILSMFFIIAGVIHLGMVFCVIWTIISPELGTRKNTPKGTKDQKQSHSNPINVQNGRRLRSNQQHIHNMHEQSRRMAQEAHDTAVRDTWMLHEDANYMAQLAHDSAVFDHQAAVEAHDNFASDPGFGCGPFF